MVHESGEVAPLHLCLTHLDKLVLDCLPHLCQDGDTKLRVRHLIAHGHIQKALHIISKRLPQLATDQCFMFKLHKQHFIEILREGTRNGSPSMLQDALTYARTELALTALNAYPDAYTEFKQLMQLLLFAGNGSTGQAWPDDCQSPFDEQLRQELAQLAYHMAALHTGYNEPKLYYIMAYLIRLYNKHNSKPSPTTTMTEPPHLSAKPSQPEQPSASPPSKRHAAAPAQPPQPSQDGPSSHKQSLDVWQTCRKLLQHHDDLTLPADPDAGPPLTSFKESDLQAIMQASGCNRAKAAASLSRSRNNLAAALLLELNKVMLDRGLLKELLLEYCAARDLPLPAHITTTTSSTDASDLLPPNDMGGSADSSDSNSSRSVSGDEVAGEQHMTGLTRHHHHHQLPSPRSGQQQQQPQGHHHHHPSPAEQKAVQELSGPRGIPRLHVRRAASRSPPAKMQCNRQEGTFTFGQQGGDAVTDLQGGSTTTTTTTTTASGGGGGGRFAHLHKAAKEGGAAALMEAVTRHVPDFWSDKPELSWQVWTAEFRSLLAAGDMSGMLHVARDRLAPLAGSDAGLQAQLKALMSTMLTLSPQPVDSPPGNNLPVMSDVVNKLQDVLANSCAAEGQECRLVRLMRELLVTHRQCMRGERAQEVCQSALDLSALIFTMPKSRSFVVGQEAGGAHEGAAGGGDPFEGLIRGHPGHYDTTVQDAIEAHQRLVREGGDGAGSGGGGGGEAGGHDVQEHAEGDDEEEEDEEVWQVMEILAVTRAQALALLDQYGDVQAAVNSAFNN